MVTGTIASAVAAPTDVTLRGTTDSSDASRPLTTSTHARTAWGSRSLRAQALAQPPPGDATAMETGGGQDTHRAPGVVRRTTAPSFWRR